MDEKEKPDIKVTDKRKFDSSGERREDAPEDDSSGEPSPIIDTEDRSTASGVGGDKSSEQTGAGMGGQAGQPEINFTAFIISLATQAMVGMGLMPDPRTQQQAKNLDMARQMIDIIAMLRDKTKGNLEAGEITTVDNILYDLRQNFVQVNKQQDSEPEAK